MSGRRCRAASVVAAYIALDVWSMWPVVEHAVVGRLYGIDATTSAWSLWWMKECLLHARYPWFTDAMFAPGGTSLAVFALAPLLGVVWSPVTLLLGPAQAVNALSLVLPPLAACAMYRLARALAYPPRVAFATGVFFGFAPITLGRAAVHVMLAAGMALMPVALLAAIRLRRSGRTRDAVLLGLVLAAVPLTDVSIAPLVFAPIASYWLGIAVTERRWPTRETLRLGIVCAALALAITAPLVWATVDAARSGDYRSDPALMARSYRIFGTDVLAIVRPSPGLHAPAAVTAALDRVFAPNLDVPATPGIAVLVLAAIGVVGCRRRRLARWAAVLWLVAVVLALGPRIAVGAHPADPLHAGWTPLPMLVHGQPLSALLPYSWLVQVPGLGDFRVAQRFNMLAALPATLLAGLGLQWLLQRRATAGALALCVLAVLEMGLVANVASHVPLTRPQVYGPIRRDPTPSIVVDVPLGWVTSIAAAGVPDYRTEPILRAAQHRHPIAWGFVNRLSDRRLEMLAAEPFYAGLLVRQHAGGPSPWPTPHPPRDPSLDDARASRAALGVGWVVLYPEADRAAVVPWLEATGFTWSHRAGRFDVYRAPTGARSAP